jgi:hypothetical protein
MRLLILLLIFITNGALAWECDEKKGIIEIQDVITLSEKCAESEPTFCVIFVSAPHNIDDRAFDKFTIRNMRNNKPVGSFEIAHTRFGSNFKAEFSLDHSEREHFEISAFYVSFSHGCSIVSTKSISEI